MRRHEAAPPLRVTRSRGNVIVYVGGFNNTVHLGAPKKRKKKKRSKKS